MSQGFEPNHLAGGGDQQLLVTASLRFARWEDTLPSLFFLFFISAFPQSFDIRGRGVAGGSFSLLPVCPFSFLLLSTPLG